MENLLDFKCVLGIVDVEAHAASPYINHFLQPDTLISDYTNPQALNRYSYVGNRPVNFNDPTGHDDVPWWEALKYVAKQFIKNGNIEPGDWVDAANTYMPATHQGSNFNAIASYGIKGGGGVVEANYVTTKNGEFQLFLSHGEGLASTQVGTGYAMGVIEGKFSSTKDFAGNFAQASAGANSQYLIGGSADVWGGLTTEKGKPPKYNGVWGYDFAVTGSNPGGSGSLVFGNAKPANEVVDGLLKKYGLADTLFGKGYSKYANNVSYFQMSGFSLYACRAMSQCGRSWGK